MRLSPSVIVRGLGRAGFLGLIVATAVPSAHALTINVTYDSSITNLGNAAAIQTAFDSVVSQFESAIANNITVNFNVAWGKVNTTPITSGLVGEALVNASGGFYSYAQVSGFMGATGATLPTTNPLGASLFLVPNAQAKALGISGITYPAYDAYIGFSSTSPFTFDDSSGIGALTYDFEGIAAHEIQHALGRVTSLTSSATPIFAYAADLFRYSGSGTNSFTYNTPNGGTPAYASVNGGVTSLGTYANQSSGSGERSDWQSPAGPGQNNPPNAQNALQTLGVDYCLSTADERLLAGLGYTFTDQAAGLFLSGEGCAPNGADTAAFAAYPTSVETPPRTPTPEPATLALLAAGTASLGVFRRRRKRT